MRRLVGVLCIIVLNVLGLSAFAQETYRKPPQAVMDVLNAPLPPTVFVSPTNEWILMAEPVRYPPIADLARPMLRLAGLRIDPVTNGPHGATYAVWIRMKRIANGDELTVSLPANARMGAPRWSPDGKRFALINTTTSGVEIWIGEAGSRNIRKIPGVTLNAAYSQPFQWANPDTLLVQLVPANRGSAPQKPAAPAGPNIQESIGRAGPVRTYQDLLENFHDEQLFEYHVRSHLAFVDVTSGRITRLAAPALFQSADVSPDGKYLIVAVLRRPFSYLHPAGLFPRTIEIWDVAGKRLLTLADQGLGDNIPIGGVRTGPRAFQWDPRSPSTVVWAEALDGGDPNKSVPHRDRILTLTAPFSGAPAELYKTEHRLAGLSWFERDPLVLITDNDRNRRWNRTVIVTRDGSSPVREVWSRSAQDLYNNPGSPVMKTLPNGRSVIAQSGDFIFLSGAGASPQGELPFFDRLDLRTLRSDRIFRSRPNTYESLVAMLSPDGSRFLTRYETSTEPPNYRVRSATGDSSTALTKFTDTTPALRNISKQLVTYTRDDGVQLSFTLYLPPDYKQGTRLPTLVWAYPTEYNDAGTAGQIEGSTSRFTTLAGPNELFFLLQGYAILHNAAMPVVGARQVVNDTYVKQITQSAKAAIDKAVEMGVTDPNRVGVGGHSYGAFMTANLLAHTDLFKAGIARSGAYNRTLTPFGFQNEDRTLWEAEETYLAMSPFMFADKLKEPVLFIHGEMDNNTGTFPIQSERMYQAVAGNGGTTRLVMLPHESHGYAARESIEHTLYEMLTWFERWVKDVPPVQPSR